MKTMLTCLGLLCLCALALCCRQQAQIVPAGAPPLVEQVRGVVPFSGEGVSKGVALCFSDDASQLMYWSYWRCERDGGVRVVDLSPVPQVVATLPARRLGLYELSAGEKKGEPGCVQFHAPACPILMLARTPFEAPVNFGAYRRFAEIQRCPNVYFPKEKYKKEALFADSPFLAQFVAQDACQQLLTLCLHENEPTPKREGEARWEPFTISLDMNTVAYALHNGEWRGEEVAFYRNLKPWRSMPFAAFSPRGERIVEDVVLSPRGRWAAVSTRHVPESGRFIDFATFLETLKAAFTESPRPFSCVSIVDVEQGHVLRQYAYPSMPEHAFAFHDEQGLMAVLNCKTGELVVYKLPMGEVKPPTAMSIPAPSCNEAASAAN